MARRQKKTPDIPSASMADIAFMLLIFFLVTTTMSVDRGLSRMLPPPVPPNQKPPKIKERNVLEVLINKDNVLAIEGEIANTDQLTEKVKEFILNPNNDPNLSEVYPISHWLELEKSKKNPDKKKIQTYERILKEIGDVPKSKGVISLQNDRGTKYEKYIEVQNAIVKAINELRNNLSMQAFGKPYSKLPEDQQKLIREVYPFSISEAEPVKVQ
jgi:biopolymer transport protein ExbD